MTPTDFQSFRIPTERIAELQDRIAKLNKKAAKLGTPPISLIITENTDEVTVSVGGSIALQMGTKLVYQTTEVLLKGETPKLQGWEFLSVVLHRPAGNEFINAPGDVDLSDYVFSPKNCDHCGEKRVRNATFLVRDIESGLIQQVGSSCLEAYTGVKSPQAHARQLENIFDMFREVAGWGSTAGRTTQKFFLQEWLAFVNMDVRDRGYVGRNKSYETGMETTAQVAKRLIMDALNNLNATVPDSKDFFQADKMIEWIRTPEAQESILSFSPDFGKQLIAACKSDGGTAVGEDTMAIVAPLAAFYARHTADKAKPVSQWIGALKDKVTLNVALNRISYSENAYGVSTIYNMTDELGNVITWFSSRDAGMEVGKSYKLAGTVKAHNDFRGTKQTILTRCKVS